MKNAIVFLIKTGMLFCMLCFTTAGISSTTLSKALQEGAVSMKADANNGKHINLSLTNLLATGQRIEIEPGTILTTGNENVQQVMLVEGANVVLSPKNTREAQVYGVCINADRSSFRNNDLTWLGQAGEKLNEVAHFVAANKLYNETGQMAVWVVSDDHDISGVSNEDAGIAAKTRQFLAQLTGKPLPWYVKRYSNNFEEMDSVAVFRDEVAAIEGDMEFYLNTNGSLAFGIYNEHGDLVELFFSGRGANPGQYTYSFKLEATGLKKGKYYARVSNNGNLVKQSEIEI